MANLHYSKNDYESAEAEYREALEIRRNLAQENPRTFLPDVSMTLNNLAILHSDKNDYESAEAEYREALEIYRNLAQDNPRTFLPYVATTLNNLANLHYSKNDYESAEAEYREALEIRRNLAQDNPRTFLPYVATTLVNLSIFYLQAIPNRQKSIALATETIQIAEQFPHVPIVQQYAEAAKQVITANESS